MRVALAVLVVALVDHANAQQQKVTVTPSDRYRASPFEQKLFGAGHRALWATPILVPVLDLKRFAGGLKPLKEGGGRQTHTLHLQGADGRQYVFRSVNKSPGKGLPPDFVAFGVDRLLHGGTALFHPTGALIAPPLLRAVSILHAAPRLYFMPPEAQLGEFTETFAGMLGLLEERAEDGAGETPGFAGSRSIVSTEKMQEKLREDARHRMDESEWLTARLVDFVIGDTDRGPNQWRWARFDDGDGFRWRPVPRDRDFAFINADGFVPRAASLLLRRLVRFEDELPALRSLTHSATTVDRAFLQSLDGSTWAAIASNVEQKLTDPVIDTAVSAMPREHYQVAGAHIAANLRDRRAQLPQVARRFYEKLATDVDVHGSDQSELAEIRRYADGAVEVSLYRSAPDLVASRNGYEVARARRAFYHRRFLPSETEEVRVYLHDGDDRAVVVGPNVNDAIKVRIIGGAGTDELFDSSTEGRGGTHTWFYDERAGNRLTAGKHTEVDQRSFVPPANSDNVGLNGDKKKYRDWGDEEGLGPALGFRANTGFIVGVQYHERDYGFRRVPFEADWRAKLMFAPGTGDFGAALSAEHHFENSDWSVEGMIRASEYDNLRFFGYGNDTPDVESDSSRVEWTLGQARGGFRYETDEIEFGLGVSMQVSDTPLEPGTPLDAIRPLGIGEWTQAGVWSEFIAAIGDRASFALDAAAYPAAASVDEPYATARGTAVVHIGTAPVLALRAIGEKIWGDAPYHDAAFIGGRKNLRGYSSYRFAGDASLVGNAELRIPMWHERLGILLLGDAGRVYFEGDSPDGWHTAYGGGVWLSAGGHRISGTYANGEDHKFYVTLGTTF